MLEGKRVMWTCEGHCVRVFCGENKLERRFCQAEVTQKIRNMVNKKGSSLTPMLTVSKKVLIERGLWENTINVKNMTRVGEKVFYNDDIRRGENVREGQTLVLPEIVGRCVLLIADIKDWNPGSNVRDDVIQMLLSGHHGPDEFVLLMMAGHGDLRKDIGQIIWDEKITHSIKDRMRITMSGSKKNRKRKHHRSLGSYVLYIGRHLF